MSDQKIQPNKVTKPIQLLAAWLVGLILINGAFLAAAKVITHPEWASGFLIIAAVINVPAFLVLIFYLQTKFRAELQEDTYYSKHLETITGQYKEVSTKEVGYYNELKNIQIENKAQFDLIGESLDVISKELREKAVSNLDVDALISKVSTAQSSLAQLEEEKAKDEVQIAINDKLDCFKDVVKAILASGYEIHEYFGSSGNNIRPHHLTISYGMAVTKSSLKKIYETVKPFGFNLIDCDNDPKLPVTSNVWIGSYISSTGFTGGRAAVAIDPTVSEMLLNDAVSMDQFSKYLCAVRTSSRS